jgi:peptide/nickel transport system permease protein
MRGASLGLGAGLVAAAVAAAVTSLVWTPQGVEVLNIAQRLRPPGSPGHPLGTDHFGRDMVSMLMAGARVSLATGLLAVAIGVLAGVPLGLWAAARRGGLADEAIMRLSDLAFAFPALVVAILITAIAGPSAANAILAVGIFNVPVFARVARGAALGVWTQDYILAAQLAGKGAARISAEHVLPNIAPILIVQSTIQFALGVLAEAGLSYVGLGAQPPLPSWGRMLADAQTLIVLAPHTALLPGLAIVLTVLGLNLLGDGLRDRLDPRGGAR